ncbi:MULTISPECIES: tyrosine-type recombinase/integrase [Acidovorax]|uniref:tyrosine-type recombinase/integrase n=1 Tax=Acidovorax TaxID=12916 RepID=UPI001E32456B|nr:MULTISPECIES: site-specific integrase [Acidovorax]HQT51510.1 site-specific integrase [Acidovorax defluvii]
MAEGIDLNESALRYLGIEHGNEAITAHRQTVDQVRAIARRRGDSAWRLIGVRIRVQDFSLRPSLEDFIVDRDLDGWSESEQLEFYEAAFPTDHKAERRDRLRRRQLELLRSLETSNAEQPKPQDMVTGWFDERSATKLVGAGFINLGEMAKAIAAGGRWYRNLPGVGKGKAQRIAAHLHTLIPSATPPLRRLFALPSSALADHPLELEWLPRNAYQESLQTPPMELPLSGSGSMLNASSDLQAMRTWIQTHAGSAATVKSFWREARVFMLWLQWERGGITFSEVKVEDCLAFRAFTENIPAHWISRERASPGQPGWAPFRGQLSQSSRHHLLNIVGALFAYLKLADYIGQNPWPLIKTRASMKKTAVNSVDTRAFSEDAQTEIQRFIDAQPPSPSRARMRFIVGFLSGVGLRASELLAARLGDLRYVSGGYVLQVIGKGGTPRVVAIPPSALVALEDYLEARGIGSLQQAPVKAPLLASAKGPMESIGYQALYLTVRTWLRNAINASLLPSAERQSLAGASAHWLRHTFATRAIKREVPMEVVQAQLGHANISTTMNIYAKAPLERQIETISAAFK